MLLVVPFILVVNQNIIKVYHNKVTSEGFKDMIHQSHKSTKDIRKTKWHEKRFIQPFLCLKGCFHASPSLILIWWYPLLKSILKNSLVSYNSSSISSKLGKRYLYLIVMLLIAWLSTHILMVPCFFGTSSVRK